MSVSGIGTTSRLTVGSLVEMRARLDDLQRQLATGKKASDYAGLGLDRGLSVGLRARLAAIGGYEDAIVNVGTRISLANTSLTRMSEIAISVKNVARLSPFDVDGGGKTSAQRNAMAQLDEMLALLNARAGDRYLFGGREVTNPPVGALSRIIEGDATHAGFKQVLAERNLADIGAAGLGRLVASVPVVAPAQIVGAGATLLPDAPASYTGNVDVTALATAGGTLEIDGAAITVAAGGIASVLADINAQLGATGVQAAQDGSGRLVLTSVNADTPVDIGPGTGPAQLLADLGIAVGDHPPTNLLTQGAVASGQTLTIAVGANPALAITFGQAVGAVSTLAELNAALAALVGGTASVNVANGELTITAAGASDSIAVGGTANAANFGVQTLTAGPTAAFSLSEDVAGSPFGFKFNGVSTTIGGISGPAGVPASLAINLTSNPAEGQTVRIDFDLPDGSVESLTLSATSGALAANQFAIGASPAETSANLHAALTAELGRMARTALSAASAIAAARDFFHIDAGQPPRRVAGPPFDAATALVAATPADTVFWYTGETGADPARGTAVARADEQVVVSYGMRANEEALRRSVEHVAVFATMSYATSDADARARFDALNARLVTALGAPGDVQRIESIAADLAGAQSALEAARERHQQVGSSLEALLASIEGVSNEEVGAQILALQTRLQASLQTTALLYRTSIIDYL